MMVVSVRQRVTYNTMVLLYKMEKNLLPGYLGRVCIELVAHILTTQGVVMTCYMLPKFQEGVNAKFVNV
jgi:hypothetical protein